MNQAEYNPKLDHQHQLLCHQWLYQITISAANRNVDLGIVDQPIGKFKIAETSSQENLSINKITLMNNGTMADGDITNIDLVSPTGAVLATVDQTTAKYVTFDLTSSPWLIEKGTSDIFTVRADTVVGSARTAQFIVQSDYDVEAVGVDTGAGILVTAGTVDTAFPIGDTALFNTITLNPGALTVSKDSTSPAGEVSAGATDVVLGTWKLQATGEDISLRQIDLELTGGTGASATCAGALAATCDLTGTVKVKDAATGTTIYSVSANTANLWDGTADVVNLASYLTIPANSSKLVQVVADVSPTNAVASDTFVARLGYFYYKRVSTNTFGNVMASGAWINANALPVSTASLTLSKNTSFAGGTLIAGASNLRVGSYVLQAGGADGVNVNTINVTLSANTGISNLTLKQGTTQLGNIIASPVMTASTNSFSVSGQLNIPAGTSVTIDVYADTSTGAGAALATSIPISGIGSTTASSGTSLTSIPAVAIAGQPIVLGVSGTLTVALNSTTTASKAILHAGETDVALTNVKLTAGTFEAIDVSKIILVARNGEANLNGLTLWDGATQVGAAADLVGGMATFSGLNANIPRGYSKTLTVKAGTNTTAVVKSQLELQVAALYVEAVGADSGVIIRPAISNSEVKLAGATFLNTYQPGDVGIIVDATTASRLAMNTAAVGSGTTPVFTYQVTAVNEAANDSISLLPIASYETAGTAGAVVYDYAVGDPVVVNDNGTIDVGVVTTAGGVGSVPQFARAAVNGILAATTDKVAKIAGAVQTETLLAGGAITTANYSLGDVVVYAIPSTSTELAMYTATTGVFTGVDTGALTAAGVGTLADVITELRTYGSATVGAAGAVTTMTFTAGEPVVIYDVGAGVFAGICSTSTVTNIAKFQWGTNNDVVLASGDQVTKLYAQAARGNVMIIEDVEPTISLNAGSPSGSKMPSSNQEIASFDVKADGQVDMNITSLAITMSGSNQPSRYQSSFKLYHGATLLAAETRAALTTTIDGPVVAATAYVPSASPVNDYKVGDVVLLCGRTEASATISCEEATIDVSTAGPTISFSVAGTTDFGDGAAGVTTVTMYPKTILFDVNSTTPLNTQVITAGTTLTLKVVVDTSSVNSGLLYGGSTFGIAIDGTAAGAGDLTWGYTPLGSTTAISGLTISDSYPVAGNTLNY